MSKVKGPPPPGGGKGLKYMVKDAGILKLRKFLLPVLAARTYRRKRVSMRNTMRGEAAGTTLAKLKPTPQALVQILVSQAPYIGKWPTEVLLELCTDPLYLFNFSGEPIAYPDESVRTHGLIILMRGTMGTMKAGTICTTAEVAEAMSLDPAARRCAPHVIPTSTITGPAVLGELLCLTDGVSANMVRAITLCDYCVINISKIRHAIAKQLTREQLAATYTKEVRLARKAMLLAYFRQTALVMLQCWVCTEMSPSELRDVIAHLRPEVAIPGEDIVSQGAAASTMYFIRRGQTCIVVGGKVIPGAVIPAGRSFGEMGLLFHERRMATVRATTVCDLWVLSKRSLDRVLRLSPAKAKIIATAAMMRTKMIANIPRQNIGNILRTYPPFAKLPAEGMTELLSKLTPFVYPAGSLITQQMHPVLHMLVVHNGTAVSQDIFRVTNDKGSIVGAHSVVPHKSLTTIAASSMVDAFRLDVKHARHVLRKYGLLEEAVTYSACHLKVLANRLGTSLQLCTSDAVARSPRERKVDVVIEKGALPHRYSARARRQRFVQPYVELYTNPAMQLAAKQATDRAVKQLLDRRFGPDGVAYPVEPPSIDDIRRAVVAFASSQRLMHRDESDDDNGVAAAEDGELDEATTNLWHFDAAFRTNILADPRFVTDVAYMPSNRHRTFSHLSARHSNMSKSSAIHLTDPTKFDATYRRARADEERGEKEMQVLDTTHLLPFQPLSEYGMSVAAPPPESRWSDVESLGSSSEGESAGNEVLLTVPEEGRQLVVPRPLYTPIRPHSYAAVLPQSVQPPTKLEIERLQGGPAPPSRTQGTRHRHSRKSIRFVEPGADLHEVNMRASRRHLIYEDVAQTVPPEARRFVPTYEEMDEFIADVLSSVGVEGRQELEAFGDALVVDTDFLAQEWLATNTRVARECAEVAAAKVAAKASHAKQAAVAGVVRSVLAKTAAGKGTSPGASAASPGALRTSASAALLTEHSLNETPRGLDADDPVPHPLASTLSGMPPSRPTTAAAATSRSMARAETAAATRPATARTPRAPTPRGGPPPFVPERPITLHDASKRPRSRPSTAATKVMTPRGCTTGISGFLNTVDEDQHADAVRRAAFTPVILSDAGRALAAKCAAVPDHAVQENLEDVPEKHHEGQPSQSRGRPSTAPHRGKGATQSIMRFVVRYGLPSTAAVAAACPSSPRKDDISKCTASM